MKLVIDMNLSPRWAGVREQIDCGSMHRSEVGARNSPDLRIADWAEPNGRIVLTADSDLGKIVALAGRETPSVVQLRCADIRHRTIGLPVSRAIAAEAGAFMTFGGRRARIRQLPFTGT